MSDSAAPALLWLRRDLRLTDQPALLRAREAGGAVVPVFVLDRRLWDSAGAPRQAFLAGALADLHERTGGALRVLSGDPRVTIPGAARAIGAGSVHVSEEFTPYGAARDAAVREALDTEWVATGSPYAVSPGRVTKGDGSPFRVFTPFSKAWLAHGWRDPAPAVRTVDWQTYEGPHLGELPTAPEVDAALPTPTEEAARAAWHRFRDDGLADYDRTRNDPGADTTSRLSPYLHLGLIHPRTMLADLTGRSGAGVTTWRNEVCWREFYADVLHHAPRSSWENYDARFDRFRWEHDEAGFVRWQRGETGFPIVDAGMRQLAAEGWMHNRVRMITASFLVKDLHCPWQWGARFFLDHLVDGDVASNNHGWQWVMGSGTDASPYVRVFNPMLQAAKYDPSGDYVRRWVPELRGLAGAAAHEPWEVGGVPGYPERMVDHAAQRADALARYDDVRS
jgi:deoxyribodipyrimidine photo-lyase